MRNTAILLAATLVAACASPPVYYPVEQVVIAAEAQPNPLVAELVPRFAGVHAREPKATELRIHVELANRSAAPIVLDLADCALEEVAVDRRHSLTRAVHREAVLSGPLSIAPGDVQDVRLTFAMPPAFDYDEMPAFRVRGKLIYESRTTVVVLRFNRYRRPEVVYGPGWYYPYSPYPYPPYAYPGPYYGTTLGLGFIFGH